MFWLFACAGAPSTGTEDLVAAFLERETLTPTDCGTITFDALGESDAAYCATWTCFSEAWADCAPASMTTVQTTIEGAPIVTERFVYDRDGSCAIEVFSDNTADAFGVPAVRESVCTEVTADPVGACGELQVEGCAEVACVGDGCR